MITTTLLLLTLGQKFDFFAPAYPPLALQAKLSGIVTLELVTDGPPAVHGHPLLKQACLDTLAIGSESFLSELGLQRIETLNRQLKIEGIKTIECEFDFVEETKYSYDAIVRIQRPLLVRLLSLGILRTQEVSYKEYGYTPVPDNQKFRMIRKSPDKIRVIIRDGPKQMG